MRKSFPILLGLMVTLFLAGCSGSEDNQDSGVDAGQDAGNDAGSDSGGDDGTQANQTLGSSCRCDGEECEQMTVPKPAGGTIIGCDEVPSNIAGAALVCMRTYEGALATNTYFANGFCSLMATQCTGADLICSSAVFGDYDNMTTCPAGTVMLMASQDVDVMGQTATIDNKNCVPSCSTNADCRADEHDPVVDDATQYQCIDKDGIKFCYDPRNLDPDYTATAF
jgi:hypothetical protein